ncbi:MAG: carboxypeptidase-like regulatory domain-containing protein [Alistipes finegoldii]
MTGATVIVVGTQRGTTTSATGAYTLQVRNGEILEFQYLGYEKQAVSVGGQTTLDVTLSLRRRWPWTKWSSSATAR